MGHLYMDSTHTHIYMYLSNTKTRLISDDGSLRLNKGHRVMDDEVNRSENIYDRGDHESNYSDLVLSLCVCVF